MASRDSSPLFREELLVPPGVVAHCVSPPRTQKALGTLTRTWHATIWPTFGDTTEEGLASDCTFPQER